MAKLWSSVVSKHWYYTVSNNNVLNLNNHILRLTVLTFYPNNCYIVQCVNVRLCIRQWELKHFLRSLSGSSHEGNSCLQRAKFCRWQWSFFPQRGQSIAASHHLWFVFWRLCFFWYPPLQLPSMITQITQLGLHLPQQENFHTFVSCHHFQSNVGVTDF